MRKPKLNLQIHHTILMTSKSKIGYFSLFSKPMKTPIQYFSCFSAFIRPLFYSLYAAKLESGSDDSGCVRRICLDAKLDFELEKNFFSTFNFSLTL